MILTKSSYTMVKNLLPFCLKENIFVIELAFLHDLVMLVFLRFLIYYTQRNTNLLLQGSCLIN